MCLITTQKKPIILKGNLVVYKSGIICAISPKVIGFQSGHKCYKYAFDYKYETAVGKTPRYVALINFYDRQSKNMLVKKHGHLFDDSMMLLPKFICIGKGFHWATTAERYPAPTIPRTTDIVKCIVPAGSQVYFDESGLGVSNQIIICNENN